MSAKAPKIQNMLPIKTHMQNVSEKIGEIVFNNAAIKPKKAPQQFGQVMILPNTVKRGVV